MAFRYGLTVVLICQLFYVYTQPVYVNADFETGTFTGWNAYTGSCCPIVTPFTGFDSLQHIITSGNAYDPYSMGLIPVVAPGGLYSARLGNDSTGSQAERLTYTFTVKPESPFFVYRYAVVFEFPPDHPESKQPHFEINVLDEDGFPVECGSYQVASANNLPGFFANGNYRIRPWTDVGVNLTDYIGKQITISFATGDCGMGGHFGYAYIDCYSTTMKIETGNCNQDGTITFTAPPGFNYLWSTGETSQSINLGSYNHGSTVSLTLTAANGCDCHFSILVPDFVPKASFQHQLQCNNRVAFFNTSSGNQGSITSYHWDFGDSFFSNDENPLHEYDQPGSYWVTLSVTSSTGCRSEITRLIEVKPVIEAAFTSRYDCLSRTVFFKDQSTTLNGNIIAHHWEFGNAVSDLQNPSYPFTENGVFAVSLTVTSDEPCIATVAKDITVYCNESVSVFIPSSFTPNNDGKNETFMPVFSGQTGFILHVFDRWGKQLFMGKNEGWNGKTGNGLDCPQGVYLFKLEWYDNDAGKKEYTGNFSLLR